MFSEYKLSDDSTKMIELSKIFNGELGELYKKISNMEAIELIRKYYNDAKTNKKIEINLNDIGESENNYKTHLKEYNAKLNKNAKHIYKNLL
jgi:lipopolysaccharide biosynthesis regulator YciM